MDLPELAAPGHVVESPRRRPSILPELAAPGHVPESPRRRPSIFGYSSCLSAGEGRTERRMEGRKASRSQW